MNTRKPKQNPEELIEIPTERLQLVEAVPDGRSEPWRSSPTVQFLPKAKMPLMGRKLRSRLH